MSPDDKQERLQRFEACCRERGLALTVQRRRILELILDRTDHPTADQIYQDVKPHLPGVSRTTVYRVLETFVELGAITKASSLGAATRFDPMTRRHHHLVCLRCDRLIDLEDEALDAAVSPPDARKQSFTIKDFSIHFYGVCAACRTENELKEDPPGGTKRPTTRKRPKKASKKTKRR